MRISLRRCPADRTAQVKNLCPEPHQLRLSRVLPKGGSGTILVKELARRKPLRAVFRDSSYASDSTKINVEQIFKLLSPETEFARSKKIAPAGLTEG